MEPYGTRFQESIGSGCVGGIWPRRALGLPILLVRRAKARGAAHMSHCLNS